MEEGTTSESNKVPRYWEQLSPKDQDEYRSMQTTLSSSACKNRRNHSLETFASVLDTIKQFVVRNDEDDWKRALVCGICWIDNAIAVNTRQLRLLVCKCKSSINGSLQAMGYGTIPTGADTASSLIGYFPFLKNNFPELRQWTVRLKVDQAQPAMRLSDIMQNAIADQMQQDTNSLIPPATTSQTTSEDIKIHAEAMFPARAQ